MSKRKELDENPTPEAKHLCVETLKDIPIDILQLVIPHIGFSARLVCKAWAAVLEGVTNTKLMYNVRFNYLPSAWDVTANEHYALPTPTLFRAMSIMLRLFEKQCVTQKWMIDETTKSYLDMAQKVGFTPAKILMLGRMISRNFPFLFGAQTEEGMVDRPWSTPWFALATRCYEPTTIDISRGFVNRFVHIAYRTEMPLKSFSKSIEHLIGFVNNLDVLCQMPFALACYGFPIEMIARCMVLLKLPPESCSVSGHNLNVMPHNMTVAYVETVSQIFPNFGEYLAWNGTYSKPSEVNLELSQWLFGLDLAPKIESQLLIEVLKAYEEPEFPAKIGTHLEHISVRYESVVNAVRFRNGADACINFMCKHEAFWRDEDAHHQIFKTDLGWSEPEAEAHEKLLVDSCSNRREYLAWYLGLRMHNFIKIATRLYATYPIDMESLDWIRFIETKAPAMRWVRRGNSLVIAEKEFSSLPAPLRRKFEEYNARQRLHDTLYIEF